MLLQFSSELVKFLFTLESLPFFGTLRSEPLPGLKPEATQRVIVFDCKHLHGTLLLQSLFEGLLAVVRGTLLGKCSQPPLVERHSLLTL